MCICVARAQKETQKPTVTAPVDHQQVSQGWAQLQQRLMQAADLQPKDGRSQDISWLELAIDFEVATGVLLEMPRVSHPKHIGTRGRAFSAAASAVGRYVRRRPWRVGLGSQTVNCLGRSYGLPRTSGLAWRPMLLNPDTVENFFRVAGEATYASDADFFQQPPLLVPSRDAEWDAMVRRVPIYVRREERRGHEEEAQLLVCSGRCGNVCLECPDSRRDGFFETFQENY